MEPDIEITPAMLEAGTLALAKADRRVDTEEEIAANIYRAMAQVSPKGAS